MKPTPKLEAGSQIMKPTPKLQACFHKTAKPVAVRPTVSKRIRSEQEGEEDWLVNEDDQEWHREEKMQGSWFDEVDNEVDLAGDIAVEPKTRRRPVFERGGGQPRRRRR